MSVIPTPATHDAWFTAMRSADFQAAWAVADVILTARGTRTPNWTLPRHEQWVWGGRPLEGQTVLVRCYHGLGDTIQFARYLPRLTSIARDTIVWAQPALLDLLARLPDSGRLLPLHDGSPDVDYDVDIEIMELAHAFRVQPIIEPQHVPYFDVRPAERLSTRYSIGIVAQSGEWDSRRSIPAHLLADGLSGLATTALFSLQLGEPLAGMVDASCADVLTLAGRLRALDLVITVDTMVAHLAGALGVPTWTLLPYEADWRWLDRRSDSPWYPTMRLFRQPVAGDWQSVIREVRRALVCAPCA